MAHISGHQKSGFVKASRGGEGITVPQWTYLEGVTAFAASILDDADEATFKATVNLEIGTDVQAYDIELAALAGLTSAANKVPYFTGSGTASVADFTAAGRSMVGAANAAAQLALLSGAATATFSFNSQDLAAVGAIACGAITTSGNLALAANSITGTSVDINNAELQQLSNIGEATISGAQWGYLGGATANGGALIDAADYAAMLALLSGEAAAAFNLNSQALTSVGTIGCSTITVAGTRPTTIYGGSLGITKQGDAGTWAFGFHALGSDDTDRGGFGFLGAADALTYYYIGTAFNDTAMKLYANGDVDVNAHDGSTGLKLGGNILPITTDGTTVTLIDGKNLSLQEDITFTGATTVNQFKFPDNLADALSFKEGANAYMTFITTNDSEAVQFSKSVGVGTAPALLLQVHSAAAAALPAVSGTAQSAGGRIRLSASGTGILDMGVAGAYGMWLQSTSKDNLATNYALLLNLNGGDIGFGTLPAALIHGIKTTEQLRLGYDAGGYVSVTVADGGSTSIGTTTDNATGNLTLAPAGDILFNPTGNDAYPSNNYDINLGLINKKFLTLHAAELWVETLVAHETMATIGGRILVGPTTELTTDLGDAAEDTTIYVKHNNLASGDIVYLEANAKVEFMSIDSAAGGEGPYSYTVTRDKDTSGRNAWYAGDAVFNTGAEGDGFIDVYSVRGVKEASDYGPTIVGNIRNSDTYNDWTEGWAIGNLNGIYGYGADIYGAAFGKYSAADYITVEPTNGIRFLDADDVIRAQLSSGAWTLGLTTSEHVSISSTAVQIKNGATVYTDLTNAVLSLGDTANEHTLINTSGVALKDGASVYALFAATTTLGLTASEHVSISSTAVQIKNGANVYTDLTAGVLKLGLESGGEWVHIDSTGIEGYGNAVKLFEITSAGLAYLGDQANEHVKLSSSGTQIYDGAVLYATYGATTTIGLTAGEHVSISSTAVQIKNGATVYTDLTNAILTLGDSSNEHALIDTSGLTVKDGATVLANFGATVTVGEVAADKSNVYITAGAVQLRTNEVIHINLATDGSLWAGDTATSERLAWDSTNGLVIYDSANAAKIVADTEGNVYVASTVTVGGSTGVLASTLDGWKHATDATKIDGGDIYADSITLNAITGASGTLQISSTGKIEVNVADALEIGGSGNINCLAGGDITLTPNDDNPALIKFGALHNMGAAVTATRGLCFWPTDINTQYFQIGYNAVTGAVHRYRGIIGEAKELVYFDSSYDGTHYAMISMNTNADAGYIQFAANCGLAHHRQVKLDGVTSSFAPAVYSGEIDLGTANLKWKNGWYAGNLAVAGAITVGTPIATTYTAAKCTATWPNTYSANQSLNTTSVVTFGRTSVTTNYSGSALTVFNDGNAANYKGIKVQSGADNASNCTILDAFDGDGTAEGALEITAGTFELIQVSDRSRKLNIRDTAYSGLDIINNLKVRDFEFKKLPDVAQTNFVADEVKSVFPDAVTEHNGELWLSNTRFIPISIKAMQELIERDNYLQGEITRLEALISKN